MSQETKQLLIDKIRIARKANNITQSELAQLSNIDRGKINGFENGKRDIRVTELIAICKILNLRFTIGG
jgi:transcriptional regulator with XRE-family HTH domain